ncbi:MAG: 50S ribosomal protein L7/L12 [Candidatus Woesebacteria bacterium GW2011_GWB1_41_10]|uniref:Large ribosomal subunit protein bL12 n=2 Tax=Microgenomates group TaxID=1794810 RepID=A0A0G0TLL7_9BACT|nr:MAG: 50S ribosomal protein L7/L12 [Candidatus Curtissbacteria bacterium GW2011_GWA1_40_16]KKR85105.1 MAG: 50S ribosomal protein L7/L12 [Candidatus Woesebacteria bacterium GW2011_GWB1_41_10]
MTDKDKKQEDVKQAEEAAEEAEKSAEKAKEAKEEAQESAEQAQKAEKKVEEAAKEEKKETPKAQVKVSAKLGKIIEEIEKLSVLELSELVKALEEKFGVTAQAPVAAAAVPTAGADEGTSEQTTFNVILAESGANKISVIKAIRELVPTLGLKEAKDLVDAAPKQVLEGVNKENANEAKQKLETAGATVELK